MLTQVTETMASGKSASLRRKKHCPGRIIGNRELEGFKNLSEAIILQCLEDSWDPAYRKESLEFFTRGGFKICSEIAGLNKKKQSEIIFFIGGNKNESTF